MRGKLVDLTGQRFGHLVALRIFSRHGKRTKWTCACDCGAQSIVAADNLKYHHTKSCGCQWRIKRYPKDNLVNRRFGMLIVLSFEGRGRSGDGNSYWNCKCDCGGSSRSTGYNLKKGNTRSCGCQIKVRLKRANLKHGLTGCPEYRTWSGMMTRCYNEKELAYKHYGGRGIEVSERWRGDDGFENFFADMGKRPSPRHSIERERVNGNYEPGNCRWATREEQANNKRNTMRVMHKGKLTPLKAACSDIGVEYKFVRLRMMRGMPFEEAVSKPRMKPWTRRNDGMESREAGSV